MQEFYNYYKNALKGFINKSYVPVYIISLKSDGYYLNEIKFIDRNAEIQFEVFSILIEHYFHEIRRGASYISPTKIYEQLKKNIASDDVLQIQVHSIIYKIRVNIKKYTKVDYPIIASKKWNGYRINNGVFLSRGDNNFR